MLVFIPLEKGERKYLIWRNRDIVKVRLMEKEDLTGAALVHKLTFIRQKHSKKWLECNFKAFPRFLIYVAEKDNDIVGYIIWAQKSGFRPEVILELEQLAVLPNFQKRGIARKLIIESLPQVKNQLAKKHSILKHVLVTTRADNYAQKLYKKTLGAEVEATLSNLYSADEVIMIARKI